MKKDKIKYIVSITAPGEPGMRHKVYFPIDKPEKKILEDIKKYLRGNNHRSYDVYRGVEVRL